MAQALRPAANKVHAWTGHPALRFAAQTGFYALGVATLGMALTLDAGPAYAAWVTGLACVFVVASWSYLSGHTRFTAWAIVAFLLASQTLDTISSLKASAVTFPLTWLDIAMFSRNPPGLLRSVGAPEWAFLLLQWLPLLLALLILFLGWRMVRQSGAIATAIAGLRVLTAAAVISGAAVLLSDRVVGSVEAYREASGATGLWTGEGVATFAQNVGALPFLLYSREAGGNSAAGFLASVGSEAVGKGEISAAVSRFIAPEGLGGALPNIMLVHAESTFDPNAAFMLETPARNDLFVTTAGDGADPRVHLHVPALANVIGGYSWVSEFEVLLGLDSRLFGMDGLYTHASLSHLAQRTFVRYLAERGYDTTAYLIDAPAFYNYAQAYRNYGFRTVKDPAMYGEPGDDLETMKKVLRNFAPDARSPFFTMVLTIGNHSPHPCPSADVAPQQWIKLRGQASKEQECALNEYLRRAGSTEKAIALARQFLEQEQQRTGRPYVLAVYGDHQPYTFTGNGGEKWNLGLNFDAFRKDKEMRTTFLKILSSKPDPLRSRRGEALPLSMLPSLVSAYVAEDQESLYMPENLYRQQSCGPDWIGSLTRFLSDGRSSGSGLSGHCRASEKLKVSYAQSGALGLGTSPQNVACWSKEPPAGPAEMIIRAAGTMYRQAPTFRVLADGQEIGRASIANALDTTGGPAGEDQLRRNMTDYSFPLDKPAAGVRRLAVEFLNDQWQGEGRTGDTNLYLEAITIGGTHLPVTEFRATLGKEAALNPGKGRIELYGNTKITFDLCARRLSDSGLTAHN